MLWDGNKGLIAKDTLHDTDLIGSDERDTYSNEVHILLICSKFGYSIHQWTRYHC